jgi:hypothetical protein
MLLITEGGLELKLLLSLLTGVEMLVVVVVVCISARVDLH